jgi:hypothetical protein
MAMKLGCLKHGRLLPFAKGATCNNCQDVMGNNCQDVMGLMSNEQHDAIGLFEAWSPAPICKRSDL